MAEDLRLTPEEEAALDRIDRALKKPAAAAADTEDLCKTYNELKPSLQLLIKLLKKLGKIGEKAAAVLEFLMKLADTVCPA